MSPSKPSCRHVALGDSCCGSKGAREQLMGHKLGDIKMVSEVLGL